MGHSGWLLRSIFKVWGKKCCGKTSEKCCFIQPSCAPWGQDLGVNLHIKAADLKQQHCDTAKLTAHKPSEFTHNPKGSPSLFLLWRISCGG